MKNCKIKVKRVKHIPKKKIVGSFYPDPRKIKCETLKAAIIYSIMLYNAIYLVSE